MNLVTFNIRGIGNSAKYRCFRSLIREKGFDFCFIQETKIAEISDKTLVWLWGGDDFKWLLSVLWVSPAVS